ncbi:MAG: UDP-N-acetylmuramoyl-tripeptide--D-alanyl-D-alanine ligase [Gammaproteobacteria bacterium]|nr:UDP-N-acetylmuramoyl-tripeptide--D-alanyl-D-alanine ligase [Gammaproteobacteria bacterium]
MMSLSLQSIAQYCDGQLVGQDLSITQVCTDTRQGCEDALFIALQGARFDAHSFVQDAIAHGAVALVVKDRQQVEQPQVIVPDTQVALGRIAALWRQQLSIPLIAITGSNGKTTVKEMLAAILKQKGPVLATSGNFNNEIGVPLTLLNLRETHRYAVLEHGASHTGDIAYLVQFSAPTVALVTNAGAAHLEGFGSVEKVAQAKGDIYAGLQSTGTAVINLDDHYSKLWLTMSAHARQLTFGFSAQADVRGEIEADGVFSIHWQNNKKRIALSLIGRHNQQNALAAATAALAVGATLEEIQAGLGSCQPVPGRLQTIPCGRLTVIDDTYNANPDSFAVALKSAVAVGDNVWCLMGDMGEVGEETENAHRKVGVLARQLGVRKLLALGSLSQRAAEAFGEGGHVFSQQEALVDWVWENAGPGAVLLVKGSRSAHMEFVVQALLEKTNNHVKDAAQ